MGTKIQIICARPGMRRHGVEHPATATYDLDRWTEEQLASLREDPSFHVNEIDESGVVTKGDEFEAAVAAEVNRRLQDEAAKLQAEFAKAVDAAATEKVVAAEKQVLELRNSVEAIKSSNDELVAKLAKLEAVAKAKPAKT